MQLFDSLAKKKNKKKKVPFDLDAEIGETGDNVEKEDASKEQDAANEFDENLDLESFGKKKKKKKKPFNLDELEQNLPTEIDENRDEAVNEGAGEEGANVEDDYDLDVDFSKTKKKKKKKKDLDELVAEPLDEIQQALADNGNDLIFRFGVFYIFLFSCHKSHVNHKLTSFLYISFEFMHSHYVLVEDGIHMNIGIKTNTFTQKHL